jgi:hypothetical protein
MRTVASTPIVPICAHTDLSANAPATPPSKITDSTASAVGSIVITTSAFRAASLADGAATAPAAASEAVAVADLSQTRVFMPAATRFRVIADPMIPAPSTATVARASLPFAPAMTAPFLLSPYEDLARPPWLHRRQRPCGDPASRVRGYLLAGIGAGRGQLTGVLRPDRGAVCPRLSEFRLAGRRV